MTETKELKQGTQTRESPPGYVQSSIICPECGEDFFHMNGITIQHCPKCGWPK